MSEATALRQLEVLERDKRTFTMADPLLKEIVSMQSERLKDAAMMLGREWNGMFSEAHVLLIAKAYFYAKNGERELERTP